MTPEEARAVYEIAATADGGCPVCVDRLLDQLAERFPEHPWQHWNLADHPWQNPRALGDPLTVENAAEVIRKVWNVEALTAAHIHIAE